MISKVRAGIAKLAALGAVKRRGVGALQAYGGTIAGEGQVIHKHDDEHGRWKAGDVTKFTMDGKPGRRSSNDRSTPA